MPEFKIEFLSAAWSDIDQISDFHLLMVGPKSAAAITDKLLDAIQHLEDHPLMGTEHGDPVLAKNGYRKLICGDYVCVHKVIAKTVYIYRIVHGSTDYPKMFR